MNALSTGVAVPSIAKVLSDQKASMPLLDSKIVVAGHSTGGLILRGLLSRPESANLVSKAFFVNTPFFGAPKSYFVYLTGDFLPFIANDLLQRMAPNLPIVYYLAPTEKYADDVALLTSGNVKRRPGQNVGNAVVKPLVFLMQNNYPRTLPRWNDALEAEARAYHASITTPVIGWNNCTVFFSKRASPDTPGPVFPSGVTDVDFMNIDGDGTVPVSSLKGDSDPKRQIELPGGPKHDAAANQPTVWFNVAAELRRDRERALASAVRFLPPQHLPPIVPESFPRFLTEIAV